MSKKEHQTEAVVNFNQHELLALIIILNGMGFKLQQQYDANKNDSSFLKADALREIEMLKGMIAKVNKAHDSLLS